MTSSRVRAPLAVLVGLCLPLGALAATARRAPARLTAAQILQKHAAARGGLQAWHRVQSMSWSGKMDAGYPDSASRSARYVSAAMARRGAAARIPPAPAEERDGAEKQVQLPFVLELKRPDKSRIEITFAGEKAVQVFDGANGWMLRPFLNRDDWEPFSPEQARSQRGRWDLDGPLLDHAAQGTKVELVSVERVDGRDAYKLKLTRRDGEIQHVWIDAKTFLDVKIEGTPRRMDGKLRSVWVTQRDFRSVHGLMVPFVLETAVDGYADTHRMVLERVAVNPPVGDARFEKPRS